ncbi:MAG: DUF4113 domain-containing protein [Pseudanabaena sp.]
MGIPNGSGTIRFASEGMRQERRMRSDLRSLRFTSLWDSSEELGRLQNHFVRNHNPNTKLVFIWGN